MRSRPTRPPARTDKRHRGELWCVCMWVLWCRNLGVVAARTVPSMRRKGRPMLVCHVCGDFSTRLLMVCGWRESKNVGLSSAGKSWHVSGGGGVRGQNGAYVAQLGVLAEVRIREMICKGTTCNLVRVCHREGQRVCGRSALLAGRAHVAAWCSL